MICNLMVVFLFILTLFFLLSNRLNWRHKLSDEDVNISYIHYGSDVKRILTFGPKQSFISLETDLKDDDMFIGQNIVYSYEMNYSKDVHFVTDQMYFKVFVYQLDEWKMKRTEIELYKLVNDWNSKYYPRKVLPIKENTQKTSLIVYAYLKENINTDKEYDSKRVLKVDLETLQVEEVNEQESRKEETVISPISGLKTFHFTNIPKIAYDKGVTFEGSYYYKISVPILNSKGSRTQFYKEMKGLSLDADRKELPVVIQSSRISDEELFQSIRQILADEGQGPIDVIATDPVSGEETKIESVAQYKEWAQKHPHLFKKPQYSFLYDIEGRTKEDPGY